MSHKPSAILLVLIALSTPALIPAQNSAKLNEELPAGAMQQKATTACLGCHEARIILQQRLSKAVWTKEVDKMVKWGAVVDANDRDALIDYLSGNFGPGQPEYSAPRSAQEKTTVRSTRQKSK
jgi:hypothetical protein